MKTQKIDFTKTLQKAINRINGNDYDDTAEITIDARVLYDRGWEYIEDYYDFKNNKFPHEYTEEELKDYQSFVDASEVRLFLRLDSQMDFLINRVDTDWSQADAFIPAGDKDLLTEDLNYLMDNNII